nr:uncharacterized protein CTRU02_15221 [Colletotrichum truncatum]KAF6781268.1 hypothetical protein CTRU02_15221 [Colletotrichum truncatum]
MCLRARELKTTISAWVEKHSLQEQFSLVETDWEALDILLDITSPFLLFTNILSRLNNLTPGHTFTLLQVATVHLYFCASALKDKVTSKDFTWISILQAATKKGQEKLEKYVQKLIEEDSFKVYGIATLLTPEAGTSVSSTFDTRFQFANYFEYLPSSASLRTRVQQEFIEVYTKQYHQDSERHTNTQKAATEGLRYTLHSLLSRSSKKRGKMSSSQDARNICNDFFNIVMFPDETVQQFWVRLDNSYPRFHSICRMARDFLSIQPTSIPLERSFSLARHICHYARFNLSADTIFDTLTIKISQNNEAWLSQTTLKEVLDDTNITEASEERQHIIREAFNYSSLLDKADIQRYLKVSDDLTKISITATGDAPSPPPYEVSVEEEDISDRDEELPSLSSSQQPKLSSQVSQLSNSPTPSVSQELPNFSELGGRKRKRLTRLDLVELSPDEDSD